MSRIIDHIVYCVPNLELAIKDLESRLGIRPTIGGRHINKGSKNALVHLGEASYLEVLAIDTNNKLAKVPRWMGLDLISNSCVTRWCLKSENLFMDAEVLQKTDANLGQIDEGKRALSNGQFLTWKMIMPLAEPVIDILPFMTDWTASSSHPCDQLDQVCKLKNLHLFHPNPEYINQTLRALGSSHLVTYGPIPKINIEVEGPNGLITL